MWNHATYPSTFFDMSICSSVHLLVRFSSGSVAESGRPQEARPQVEGPGHEGGVRGVRALGRGRERGPRRGAGADRGGQEEQGRGHAGLFTLKSKIVYKRLQESRLLNSSCSWERVHATSYIQFCTSEYVTPRIA